MKKILLLSALAFICLNQTYSQCTTFTNPSFTGGTEGGDSIPHWTGCVSAYETTLPNSVITLQSRDGGAYAGLLFQDIGGGITQGAISQMLNTTLVNNDTLTIGLVDIPTTNNLNPDYAECEVFGGDSLCGTLELLWTSPVIPVGANNTSEWIQDTFIVHPAQACTYITIMVNTNVPTAETGHGFYIGVDSLTINCAHTTTGIYQINDGISIYPNPAFNSITLNIRDNTPYTVTVYDLSGREIIARELTGATNTVDVSQLAKGAYLAKIIQGDKSYCQKMIIQ